MTIDLTTLLNVIGMGAFVALCWADWKVVERQRVRVDELKGLVAQLATSQADHAMLVAKYATANDARIAELESRHREFCEKASAALTRSIAATDTMIARLSKPAPDEALEAMRGK